MTRQTAIDPAKLHEDDGPVERGYAAWKRAKIAQAQAQADDRAAMIDADAMWAALGCDD